MPLAQGSSNKTVGSNIAMLEHEGRKPSQAIAIAMHEAGRSKPRRKRLSGDAIISDNELKESVARLGFTPEQFKAATAKRAPFETPLNDEQERAFQAWKARYAPRDSGADYDLRGAFLEGLTPDARTGHWPDTYKKPNHPTFSDESKYAMVAPERAGHWNGDAYVPPKRHLSASEEDELTGNEKAAIISDEELKQAVRAHGMNPDALKHDARRMAEAARASQRTATNEFTTGPGGQAHFMIPGTGQATVNTVVPGAGAGDFVRLNSDPRDYAGNSEAQLIRQAPRATAEYTVGPGGQSHFATPEPGGAWTSQEEGSAQGDRVYNPDVAYGDEPSYTVHTPLDDYLAALAKPKTSADYTVGPGGHAQFFDPENYEWETYNRAPAGVAIHDPDLEDPGVPTDPAIPLSQSRNVASSDRPITSDERSKKRKSRLSSFDEASDGAKDAALDAMHPYSFEYKKEALDMGAPRGRINGVMAQDMQKAPLSREVVNERPNQPLTLDPQKAISLSLALNARLGERVKKLEEGR